MKRTILVVLATLVLTAASVSVPVYALGNVQVTLTCSDGTTATETELVVDAEGLIALKDAVEAMALYPAGLSCSFVEVPLGGLLSFGLVAQAANGPQDVFVGGGTYTQNRGDCSTIGNPSGTVEVHMNVSVHREAANPSTTSGAFGHLARRVHAPGNPCHGDESRAVAYCLTIVANEARTEGSHTVATGTFGSVNPFPGGVDPLAFTGLDMHPMKPDLVGTTNLGHGNCQAGSNPPPTIPLLKGNISVHDRL